MFDDKTLSRIAMEQPTDKKALEAILGAQKTNKFGDRIIAVVTKWLAGTVSPVSLFLLCTHDVSDTHRSHTLSGLSIAALLY